MERITDPRVVDGLGLSNEQKDILLERLGIEREPAKIIPMWKEYVLDITHEPYCFRPYNRERDMVILIGASFGDRCPGDLIGVVHETSQEASDKWIGEHPNWHEEHGPELT